MHGDGWRVYDTARDTFNPMEKSLAWNSTAAETSGASHYVDTYSNGFKPRAGNPVTNWGSPYGPLYIWLGVTFHLNITILFRR